MLSARTRMGAALFVGLVTAAAGLGTAAPASAALVTRCVGEGGAVTVPGDLVIPAGQSCDLTGTTVNGNVRVASGASLIGSKVTLNGKVDVAADGFAEIRDASVEGKVTGHGSFGVYLIGSELGSDASLRRSADSNVDGFLFLEDSSLDGTASATTGELVLTGSRVGGNLIGRGNTYVDAFDSVVDGDVSVIGTSAGSVICDSEVFGNALFRSNAGSLQLGAHSPISLCSAVTYWGGNVKIVDNTATTDFSNNIVRRNLVGTGNNPAPVGHDNRVRGTTSGQFRDLQVAPDSATRKLFAGAGDASAQGTDEVKATATQRQDAAAASAAVAGRAQL